MTDFYVELQEEYGTARAYSILERAKAIAKDRQCKQITRGHIALAANQLAKENQFKMMSDHDFILMIHDHLAESGIEPEHDFMQKLMNVFFKLADVEEQPDVLEG